MNLNGITESRAVSTAEQVVAAADDPDRLWENYDSLQALVESKHGAAVYDTIVDGQAVTRLRDAWAQMHDVTFEPGDYDYMLVGGDEGYKAYWDTSQMLIQSLKQIEEDKQ